MIKRASHLFGNAIRETGQAMDRLGLMITGNDLYKETYSRHRPIMNIYDKVPTLAKDNFVAPNASVIGKVITMDKCSFWYGSIVRADINSIRFGFCTNVQDRAVITTQSELDNGYPADVVIGNYVTVGHGSILTSCIIQDEVHIGAGSVVGAGSIVESKSILAPGSVVAPGTLIPSGQLWGGNPAVFVKNLDDGQKSSLEKTAEAYFSLAEQHKEEFLPYGTLYQQAEK